MGNIQAVIDLPEQLYLSLSGFGLTKERIANESRKLRKTGLTPQNLL